MATIKIDRLEDVRAGDRVTLRDGDVTITGPARKYASSSTYFYVYSAATEISERTFVSAERDVPDLPTKPGAYVDQDGAIAVLTDDPDALPWLCGGMWVGPRDVRSSFSLPLVPLVPKGSEAKALVGFLKRIGDNAGADSLAESIERGDWNE